MVFVKSPRGEMFFCSSVGLTSFFPRDIVDDSYVPPLVLTDFLLSDKPVPVGGDSPLKKSITATHSLVHLIRGHPARPYSSGSI